MAKIEAKFAERERMLEKKEQLTEIKQFLNENKDDYELIHVNKYAHKVQEVMDHYYENEKQILSYSQAARALEIELEKHERQKTQALAQTKKGKEYLREYLKEDAPEIKTIIPKTKEAKVTKEDSVVEPIVKPKPVIPVPKKPVIKLQTVSNNQSIETSAAFKAPLNKGKSKAEVMARIIAQHGG